MLLIYRELNILCVKYSLYSPYGEYKEYLTRWRVQPLSYYYYYLVTMLLYRSFFTLVFLSSFLYRIATSFLYSPFQEPNQCILHLTACQEFAHLYRTPTLFSLVSSRSRRLRTGNPFLCAFFLLCGDVEPNPCPTNFTLCTLNIRSILQPLHSVM